LRYYIFLAHTSHMAKLGYWDRFLIWNPLVISLLIFIAFYLISIGIRKVKLNENRRIAVRGFVLAILWGIIAFYIFDKGCVFEGCGYGIYFIFFAVFLINIFSWVIEGIVTVFRRKLYSSI